MLAVGSGGQRWLGRLVVDHRLGELAQVPHVQLGRGTVVWKGEEVRKGFNNCLLGQPSFIFKKILI